MKFLSVCSGIEAASVAWEPLGWEAVAFSEIEKFPSAVLAHHWPDVPNLGDMTQFNEWKLNQPIDLLVGGTPCQSFSVAGLRKGLQDPRGNLTLTFLAMAEKFKPRWVVWENVPGVLSDRTNAFGQFLAGLGELGYGFAYRVLDAQHFGVPQRRRRVFVVGCLGDWQRAAKVLFEPESMCGDLTPSREKREGSATSTPEGSGVGSLCARTGRSMSVQDAGQGHLIPEVAHCIQTTCHDYSRADGFNMIPQTVSVDEKQNKGHDQRQLETATLTEDGWICNECDREVFNGCGDYHGEWACNDCGEWTYPFFYDFTDGCSHCGGHNVLRPSTSQVRRLTPTECERLQGFTDDHTLIPWRNKPAEECPDGPRYKALGNSMAVPVMAWIGQRIASLHNV